jgi:hypothetical protein
MRAVSEKTDTVFLNIQPVAARNEGDYLQFVGEIKTVLHGVISD